MDVFLIRIDHWFSFLRVLSLARQIVQRKAMNETQIDMLMELTCFYFVISWQLRKRKTFSASSYSETCKATAILILHPPTNDPVRQLLSVARGRSMGTSPSDVSVRENWTTGVFYDELAVLDSLGKSRAASFSVERPIHSDLFSQRTSTEEDLRHWKRNASSVQKSENEKYHTSETHRRESQRTLRVHAHASGPTWHR